MIFAFTIMCAICAHMMVSAMKGKDFRKLLLTKLKDVRQAAEKYLDTQGLPYAPNEEYP